MTIAFYENQSRHPLGAAALVLVDVCQSKLQADRDLAAAPAARILDRCQAALTSARRCGVPVVFVHDPAASNLSQITGTSRWFEGFAPRRYESVVASSGPSCYASPYFSEILDGAGQTMLLAGLLGLSHAEATAQDATAHGHRVVVLSDAVAFDSYALVPETQAANDPLRAPILAMRTEDWLAKMVPPPPPKPYAWQAGAQLRR